jgi:hypothetical protein
MSWHGIFVRGRRQKSAQLLPPQNIIFLTQARYLNCRASVFSSAAVPYYPKASTEVVA